jgi:hypothetical protein
MQLAYGGFLFPADCAKITRTSRDVSPAGIPLIREWEWSVEVVLTPANVNAAGLNSWQIQSAFAAATESIFSALSVRNLPLTLITNSGATAMSLSPAGSLSGVSIRMMGNPVGDGPEFGAIRTLTFSATASYPIGNLQMMLARFTETIERTGTGAPAKIDTPAMQAFGFRIYTRGAGVARATQFGEAVGVLQKPIWAVPPPLWPDDEDKDQRSSVDGAPERQGDTLMNYRVSWRYSFSRIGTPFLGSPRLWS